MTNTIRWNTTLLRAAEVDFHRVGESITGPPGLTGRTQTAALDTGYWVANVKLALLDAGAEVLAFRALVAEMQGGAHHVLVPTFDQGQAPWVLPGGKEANENAARNFSTGFQFSTGFGFYTPSIRVYVATAAAQGDTQLIVDVEAAGTIKAGQRFSINGRLYEIRRIVAEQDSPPQKTLAILPRLRAAAAVGDTCEFERPICRMKLAAEGDASLVLGHLWRGAPRISLVEAID